MQIDVTDNTIFALRQILAKGEIELEDRIQVLNELPDFFESGTNDEIFEKIKTILNEQP